MVKESSKVRLKIELGNASIGPGKILLLEAVDQQGSISGAGRALGMNYRRAWFLLNTLQEAFSHPVISTETGGKEKGGASVTSFGKELIEQYRLAETMAQKNSRSLLDLMQEHMAAPVNASTTSNDSRED